MAVAALCWLIAAATFTGCATNRHPTPAPRAFDFSTDTLAYANGLVWEYYFDDAGNWVHRRRDPKPDYYQHCFVVARSARQFFEHAEFNPALAKADPGTYRRLAERVIEVNPRRLNEPKIIIPGYANLRAFSEENGPMLKDVCGAAWQSYVQRGHWRMIIPMTHRHQAAMAEQLAATLRANHPAVIHIFTFPKLSINHALLLFGIDETSGQIRFSTYDPNTPDQPTMLIYDRVTRSFQFPANSYFSGGPVKVYQIYHAWNY